MVVGRLLKSALILFLLLSLLDCGGERDLYSPTSPQPPLVSCEFTYSEWGECQTDNTQFRTVISQQPEGCEGDPVLTQDCIYIPPVIIPEPIDCCPKGENVLLCKNYQTESPYLTITCNAKGYWYLKVKDMNSDWTVPLWIKLPLPDLSCCSIEKTGLLPEQCTVTKPCPAYYTTPTEWILFSTMEGWYIGNMKIYYSYKVMQ